MPSIVHISSRDNARVKEARRIRDTKQRDKIFLEGVRLFEEAIRSQAKIDCVFVSVDAYERNRELVDRSGADAIYELTDPVFRSIADTTTSQGLVALTDRPSAGRAELEKRLRSVNVPIAVFLYEVNNPSNLGAVIRSAEAAGVAGVIISKGSADAFSPKAVRAAMGSSFRLPVWTDVDVSETLDWAMQNNLAAVGVEAGAETSHTDIDWTRPSMILLGSEAHGLSGPEFQNLDERVFISMESPVESLNLAVACGVILFEARRQNSAD